MSFEYPFPPISYEDDGRLMARIEQNLLVKISNNENEAIVKAIREYGKEKGNLTLIEIPENRLLKVLIAGAKAVRDEQILESITTDFSKTNFDPTRKRLWLPLGLYEIFEDYPDGVLVESVGKPPAIVQMHKKNRSEAS